MHLKHAVNGTSDSTLKKIQAIQNLGSQFLEIAQLPFNSKCDENMFRLCRLSLFSLSVNNVASFWEIWLEAVESFLYVTRFNTWCQEGLV